MSCKTKIMATQPTSWFLPVSFLGFLYLLKLICIPLLKWLYTVFLRPPKNLNAYGSWVLITGATDGIGKAFAFQFARRGLNLLLVSRNPAKLQSVSNQIQSSFPATKIKTLDLDFSHSDLSSGVGFIEEAIEGLDVGILVNNVGITYPEAMYFHEVDEKVWMDIVRVNLEGTTMVTRAVLPGMLKRKRGAIVNIGSGAAIVVPSHPLYAIYAATKAFVDQLSRCLHVEYKQFGIDVQCQVPLYVATKMVRKVAAIEKPSVFVPSAEDYAAAAVRRIGFEPRCTPYWAHSLQWFFVHFLPDPIVDAWRLSIGIRRSQHFNSNI